MKPLKVFTIALLFLLTSFSTLFGQGPGNDKDLTDLFDRGYILKDFNKDSVIDGVDVKFVLSDNPGSSEIVAASNIAARLGYETSAMDLDGLVASSADLENAISEPVIIIGKKNISRFNLDREVDADLTAGEGQIIYIPPNNHFKKGGFFIYGYDATGLIAVSDYLSARFPSVYKVNEKSFRELLNQLQQTFQENKFTIGNIHLNRLTISAKKAGVKRADIEVSLKNDEVDRLSRYIIGHQKELLPIIGENVFSVDFRLQDSSQTAKTIRLDNDENAYSSINSDQKFAYSPDFTLSDLYSIHGLYQDTNGDSLADKMDSYIYYSGQSDAKDLVEVAARIGLETPGVRLPLVRLEGENAHPEKLGFPIFFGVKNSYTQRLRDSSKVYDLDDQSNEGYIQFIPNAKDDKNGLVIGANDRAGLSAISDYISHRMPYLWNYGKGEYRLKDVETDVRRFFQGVNGAGQVANGLTKLSTWFDRIKDENIDSLSVELDAKKAPEGLEAYIRQLVQTKLGSVDDPHLNVKTHTTGFGVGDTVFKENFTMPWEVDNAWDVLNSKVLNHINQQSKGKILIRVSEPPEVREQFKNQIYAKLKARGASKKNINVEVLSAYKQGFSWLKEEVIPKLKDKNISHVDISYYNLKKSKSIKWQQVESDTRWLQELYPIDTEFSKKLGLADSLIEFHSNFKKDPVYTVKASDAQGEVVFQDSFNPKYVVRPFFKQFPKYDSVRVTTGWIKAQINNKTYADERIKTDIEEFWDHFQDITLDRLLKYVMNIQDGDPSPELAPYFDRFDIKLALSEADYQLGFFKEQIAPMEALQEDLYWETRLFFRLIGNRYGVGPLSYPGRILPYHLTTVDGKPGEAEISLTGKKQARPQVKLTYRAKGKASVTKEYELPNINVSAPKLRGIWVRKNANNIEKLMFDVKVDSIHNPYDYFKKRATEREIDNTFSSAERMRGMLDQLKGLHQHGMFQQYLNYDKVNRLDFHFLLNDSLKGKEQYSSITSLGRSKNPQNTNRPHLMDADFTYRGQEVVQDTMPIPPSESNAIMAKLNTFPEANVYYAATSFLGQHVFAMDLLPLQKSNYVSQAKLSALKPTLFVSGRQHANEFSSTTHILRLGEKLLTDPDYKKYLNKVNVVLHPITNVDGARQAVKDHLLNPTYMGHLGYLGALGVDVTRDQNKKDPRYPEAKVRRVILNSWLPDVYLNMHGYPTHEWVQYFAGYTAWIQSRYRGARSNNYWIPRGFFIPGFSWLKEEDHPEFKKASFALIDSITADVSALPEMRKVDQVMQRRYHKYRSKEDTYVENYINNVLVYSSLKGIEPRKMRSFEHINPKITYFSAVSEFPDEPAQGSWLQMNVKGGVAFETACLKYLYNGISRVKHDYEDGFFVRRSEYRKRPVLPPEEK